jgi:hypothetical protein
MASSQTGVLHIIDCSRGLSDWYPARLDDDQLDEAWDVEFHDGAVCGRRHGCLERAFGVDQISHSLFVYTPTTDRANDRLMLAFNAPAGAGAVRMWNLAIDLPGAVLTSAPDTLDFSQGVDWASLHGKLFIATKSNANRLHVYDGTGSTIRRTGMLPPSAPPVVTNSGSGGFTSTRQYRLRYLRIIGGVTLLRSEPTASTTFTPSGSAAGAQVAWVSDPSGFNVTHWQVEEIAANGSWYAISPPLDVVVVSTYLDTLALSAVPTSGVLSEDVGDYTVQYSARWLTVDEDRLLLGGSFDEESKSARVSWTPLGGQIGVGNDERLPSDVDGFLDFDTLDGGGLTGIRAWEGKVIVFKRGQVHQMIRSSSRLRAYLPDTLSRKHGAIPFSVVEGTDDQGLSCLYFLDPDVGPMQLGFRGLRVLCPQMQRTWRASINLTAPAATICNVTYHAEKRQVWWHIATGPNTQPNVRWMYSVESDGLVFHTLPKATKAATYFAGKPTLAYDTLTGGWTTLIGQGDIPGMVVDYLDTFRYRAYITTKAYQLGQLLRRFQIDSALLEAGVRPGAVVSIVCRRDYGTERRAVPVVLDNPPGPVVDLLVVPVDNSYMTEAITMQLEIGDSVPLAALAVGAWQVHGLTLAWSLGSPSTGRG